MTLSLEPWVHTSCVQVPIKLSKQTWETNSTWTNIKPVPRSQWSTRISWILWADPLNPRNESSQFDEQNIWSRADAVVKVFRIWSRQYFPWMSLGLRINLKIEPQRWQTHSRSFPFTFHRFSNWSSQTIKMVADGKLTPQTSIKRTLFSLQPLLAESFANFTMTEGKMNTTRRAGSILQSDQHLESLQLPNQPLTRTPCAEQQASSTPGPCCYQLMFAAVISAWVINNERVYNEVTSVSQTWRLDHD